MNKVAFRAMLMLFLTGFTLNAQVVEPLPKDKIDEKKRQEVTSSTDEFSFHIIAGVFRIPDNAVKKLNQLKALGYNARLLGINQVGLTRVAYGSYNNIVDARYNLAKIKKTINKDAWLLDEKISSTETNWKDAVIKSGNVTKEKVVNVTKEKAVDVTKDTKAVDVIKDSKAVEVAKESKVVEVAKDSKAVDVTKDKAVEVQELGQPTKEVKNQVVEAKILVKNADGFIDVRGIVENPSKIYIEDYDFNLVALKLDASGKYLKNEQSGVFSLKPNERKNLTTLKVVIKDSDVLKLFFFIRKDEKLISRDTAVVVSKVKKLETKPIAEETIEIYGLVVEDVVTKLGKDFYDFFYQEYNTSGAKYPFVIRIIEKPLLGINSEVRIDIDDKMVYKMTTRPNEEYLQSSARQALVVINNYNEKRKFLFKKDIKF